MGLLFLNTVLCANFGGCSRLLFPTLQSVLPFFHTMEFWVNTRPRCMDSVDQMSLKLDLAMHLGSNQRNVSRGKSEISIKKLLNLDFSFSCGGKQSCQAGLDLLDGDTKFLLIEDKSQPLNSYSLPPHLKHSNDKCFLHSDRDFFFFFFLAALGLRCCVRAFSIVVASGGYSSLRCEGFSLRWLLLLRSTGSRCAGFSSCSTWAQ